MLDAYIIEQIRKRDDERRRIYERPGLQLPLEPARPPHRDLEREEEKKDAPRVVIIDL